MIIKKLAVYSFFLLVAVILGIGIGHCEEKKTPWWISPIWNPQDPIEWNLAKVAGYGMGAWDAAGTSRAQERAILHGYHVRELNFVDNWWIDSRHPEWAKRQVSSVLIQYGFNLALDLAWHDRSTGKLGRVLVFGLRLGLCGQSAWAIKHNNSLGR